MNNILTNPKLPYKDALLSKKARNCGIYVIFENNKIVYIGKASGQTIKRRLAEHTSKDNQFNSLAKKVAGMRGIPLDKLDDAIDYIEENYKVILISMPMHSYDDSIYVFDKEKTREKINSEENKLIKRYNPVLNKRGKLTNLR